MFVKTAATRRASVVVGAVALSVAGLTACGTDTSGPETGADVEDIQEEEVLPYDGVYDSTFAEDLDSYVGQAVTVSADVNEVVSPTSFTIAGTEDTTVEPLLVVSASETQGLEPALAVQVTGVVHQAFDLPTVEEELGVDLDDELFTDWDGEPYLEATVIDTSVPVEE